MDFEEKIYQFKKQKSKFVIATIVDTKGSVPAKIASKIIILSNGETFGTVGGGELENAVIQKGLELLKNNRNQTYSFDLSQSESDSSENVGMLCGGNVWVFFESITPKTELYIFGGGHISQSLQKIIDRQKFQIIIVDNRKDFANPKIHPNADEVHCEDYDKFSNEFTPAENSFIVIVTHGHKHDYEILRNIYKRKLKLKYVGMIGSKIKVKENVKALFDEIGKIALPNLFSPIGLKVGGNSTYEIAISIVSEMQAVLYDKEISHLRMDYEKL
ncbi:MAG: XdhC/CoxI family protein [Candidatus Cloacimonadota bacterium]|nr:XdhC/CoxI family protein [Candidatus Cloacimonadota bacterium]